jgi:uncharacterized protein
MSRHAPPVPDAARSTLGAGFSRHSARVSDRRESLLRTTNGLSIMPSLIDYVLQNNLEGLKESLARGADPNQAGRDGRTPLIHAAIDNQIEVANKLLNSKANVNAQDTSGNSSLHYAAQDYHCEMVRLLLDNGADVNIQDAFGNTPLWRAVFNSRGRGDVIGALLKAGADRNLRNKAGKTPLELAKTIANYNISQFFA